MTYNVNMDKFTGTIALNRFMTGVKVLLSLAMMLGGFTTALSPVEPLNGALGFIFSSRITLVVFGVMFFVSGVAVLYGSIRKRKALVGRGLMFIYLITLFTFLLELVAFPGISNWIDNFVISLVAAACWLWWKFRTEYLSMGEIRRMRQELQELHDDS
jgi:hypothetical protein